MVIAKPSLNVKDVVDELACALDMARFEIKNPGSTPLEHLLPIIEDALDMCIDSEESAVTKTGQCEGWCFCFPSAT